LLVVSLNRYDLAIDYSHCHAASIRTVMGTNNFLYFQSAALHQD
jgi:hypothetical protein